MRGNNMDNILEVDLNEFVSKKFAENMESMQSRLDVAQQTISEQQEKIQDLKDQIKNLETMATNTSHTAHLLNIARKKFSEIKAGERDDGGWFDSKQKIQFHFISQLMLNLFGIENKVKWLSSRGDGSLKVYLAVAYYQNKEEIKNLVRVLTPEYKEITTFIDSFIMPYDYAIEDVLSYVKKPHYCTNGAIYDISQYWIEAGAKKTNMPHSLIMMNSHILEDNVFEELLSTITMGRSDFVYLFALPKYNKEITDEQIARLGECLIGLKSLKGDVIEGFIKNNIRKFNGKTLDFLFQYVNGERDRKSVV
jgi:hypothetical protein